MPEAPELAHSRDSLRKIIVGRNLLDVEIESSGRYAAKPPVGLGAILASIRSGPVKISAVETKGKLMWWTLVDAEGNDFYLHAHYGMAGAWQTKPTKHTAVTIVHGTHNVTRDQRRLCFNDPRHFGTIKFIRGIDEHQKKLKSLGPCILNDQVTAEIFAKRLLHKPSRSICEALMDQSGVSGVGNYLRAEILFDVGVNPWRGVTELTPEEYSSLCASTLRIAQSSYSSQGATIKTYQTVDGSSGSAQFSFKVYSMKSCPLDHEIQRRQDSGGRTVHWCPICQK